MRVVAGAPREEVRERGTVDTLLRLALREAVRSRLWKPVAEYLPTDVVLELMHVACAEGVLNDSDIFSLQLHTRDNVEFGVLDVSGTQLTDVGMRLLLRVAPQVRELDISRCDMAVLEALAEHPLPHVTHFTCVGVQGKPGSLNRALRHMHEALVHVNLSGSAHDAATAHALAECTHLESLTMRETCLLGEDGLAWIAAACPRLQRVDMLGFALTNEALMLAAPHLTALRELELSRAVGVSTRGVREVVLHSAQLEVLVLDRCGPVAEPLFAALAEHCPRLRRCSVYRCSGGAATTNAAMAALSRCRALEELTFTECAQCDADVYASVASLPLLHSLYIDRAMRLDDAALTQLAALPLRHLKLHACEAFTVRGLLAVVSQCDLETLWLNGCCPNVDDAMFAELAPHLHALRDVSLHGIPGVTDATLRVFAEHCAQLHTLSLNNSGANDPDERMVALLMERCALHTLRSRSVVLRKTVAQVRAEKEKQKKEKEKKKKKKKKQEKKKEKKEKGKGKKGAKMSAEERERAEAVRRRKLRELIAQGKRQVKEQRQQQQRES